MEEVKKDAKRIETEEEKPLDFTWDRLVKMGFHVFRQFDDPYYAGFAAQIAYFFFMSSIPALIVLTQVLGIFDVSLDFIIDWMNRHMDSHLSGFVMSLFTQSSSVGFTNVLLVLLAIWAASSLEFSLARLTNHILTDGRYRYTYFGERIKSIPMAFLIIIVIAFSLIAYVYGEWIINRLVENSALATFLIWLRGPLLFAMFFVMVFGVYVILPRVRVSYKAMIPGSIIATIGMVLVTYLYSFYVGRTTSYDILYGSFANIVALLLWFFLISWALCIGMMFNRSWDIYMAKGRLNPKLIKETLKKQIGINEKNFNQYYTSNPARFDRTTDTLANQLSRRFVPGYAEARDNCEDKYDNAPDRERDS
ncbi:MAG: YihY/virulence factor BrkB family protein [Clostridiales bacterium]|nr:YihY/virulence factor BrkB family protein [Candidatus Crickella merdequi]